MSFYGIAGLRRAETLFKFSVRSLARSQGLMQTSCTLALLFGLPLSALAAKGRPNPTPGLPIAGLLSLIQSFKKTLLEAVRVLGCVCVATLPPRPFAHPSATSSVRFQPDFCVH